MKKLALIILAVGLSGCCSIVTHTKPGSIQRPYKATCIDAIRICDAAVGPMLNTPLGRQSHYDSQIMFPWLLVDLPMSFVVDTLCLPFDIW